MTFECKRCGFSCEKRYNMRDHLNRKNICPAKLSAIDVSVLLKELYPTTDPNLVCNTCNTVFIKPGMLVKHKHTCNEKNVESKETHATVMVVPDANMSSSNMMKQILELRAEVRELKEIITTFIKVQVHNEPIIPIVAEPPKPEPNNLGGVKEAKTKKACTKPKANTTKNNVSIDPNINKIKPLYSPDTSLENVGELIDKMKAVRSIKDISELVVSRCEDIYFKNPVNRSFKVSSEGHASFLDTHEQKWKDTTLTHISKEMTEFATEDFINKIEDFSLNLSIESKAAWEKVDEMYDDRLSHFFRSTSEKIVSSLFYPEMEKAIPT